MDLVARIRAVSTLILLATYSPVGIAIQQAGQMPGPNGAWQRSSEEIHFGHLGISVFTRRLTRAAAADMFDVSRAGVSRCPSRHVRQVIAGALIRHALFPG